MAVLATFGLDNANDTLAAVDIADRDAAYFAGSKTTAIGQR